MSRARDLDAGWRKKWSGMVSAFSTLDRVAERATCYAAPEAFMAQPGLEKRATRRFPLRLVLTMRVADGHGEISSHTRDVSARGINFHSDLHLDTGSPIQFTLTLPPEVTLTESISMRCLGTVVRVEPEGRGSSIAAVIDRYEFLGDS